MIKKLKFSQVKELVNLPESGMGYQLIQADLPGLTKKYLVLNAQIVIDDTPEIINEIKNVFKSDFQKVLLSTDEIELKNIRLVGNLSYYKFRTLFATKKTGAIHQKIEFASGEETFTRLSAYEDDKRIDTVSKCLKPGSFTTTWQDYQYCKNNHLDPVSRYALPNDEPIKWAFLIKPTRFDTLQRGIVERANNQEGGGIEAYFDKGTFINTYKGKIPY